MYTFKTSSYKGAWGNGMGVGKGNALILKSGGGGAGTVLNKEGDPGSTAAFNRVLDIFVIESKMETPGDGGDGGRAVGMMLE